MQLQMAILAPTRPVQKPNSASAKPVLPVLAGLPTIQRSIQADTTPPPPTVPTAAPAPSPPTVPANDSNLLFGLSALVEATETQARIEKTTGQHVKTEGVLSSDGSDSSPALVNGAVKTDSQRSLTAPLTHDAMMASMGIVQKAASAKASARKRKMPLKFSESTLDEDRDAAAAAALLVPSQSLHDSDEDPDQDDFAGDNHLSADSSRVRRSAPFSQATPKWSREFLHDAGPRLEQLPGRARCDCTDCAAFTQMQASQKQRDISHAAIALRRAHAHEKIQAVVDRTLMPFLSRTSQVIPACYDLPDAELIYCLHHRIMRDQLTQEALKIVIDCSAGKLSTMLRLTLDYQRNSSSSSSSQQGTAKRTKLPPRSISVNLRHAVQKLCWAMDQYFHAEVRKRFDFVRESIEKHLTEKEQQPPSEKKKAKAFQEWAESEMLSLCRAKVHQYLFYARSSKKGPIDLHLSPCELVSADAPAPTECSYCLEKSLVPVSIQPRIYGTYVAPSRGRITYTELQRWLQNPNDAELVHDANRDRLHAIELTLVAWLVERGLLTIHLTHKQRQVARSREMDMLPIDEIQRLKFGATASTQVPEGSLRPAGHLARAPSASAASHMEIDDGGEALERTPVDAPALDEVQSSVTADTIPEVELTAAEKIKAASTPTDEYTRRFKERIAANEADLKRQARDLLLKDASARAMKSAQEPIPLPAAAGCSGPAAMQDTRVESQECHSIVENDMHLWPVDSAWTASSLAFRRSAGRG
jgi:hypothetical protein